MPEQHEKLVSEQWECSRGNFASQSPEQRQVSFSKQRKRIRITIAADNAGEWSWTYEVR